MVQRKSTEKPGDECMEREGEGSRRLTCADGASAAVSPLLAWGIVSVLVHRGGHVLRALEPRTSMAHRQRKQDLERHQGQVV